MNYRYVAHDNFWKHFHALPDRQKESVRRAWHAFKVDPFSAPLGTHKIFSLSARYKRTVYSVVIENDLRVIFFMDGNLVVTMDVGTHDTYQ